MNTSQATIRYKIFPTSPTAHRFTVQCEIDQPNPNGQSFFLPAWIPGSYKIREFSKHIMTWRAQAQGKAVRCYKTSKHNWQCDPCEGPLMIEYEVYANDPSIRSAMLDITRGFINNSSLCLLPEGFDDAGCELELIAPSEFVLGDWHVATSLKALQVDTRGFGKYYAENYAALIDSPIEMSEFEKVMFTACDIPHEIVLTAVEQADLQRIAKDVKKICEYWINFFGLPCPFTHYLFLVKLMAHGYGGLEHRDSTAVQFNRYDLPTKNSPDIVTESYRDFLGLCSHEYFHTWHIKRMRPQAFTPYNLNNENYTRTLWVFEGMTAYYEAIALVRTKLISLESYAEILAHNISKVLRTPGRKKQTLEEASFDAWIKFYEPNENSANATISYYQKGALLALALDLALRDRTQGKISLDDVMQGLWKRYGHSESKGVPEYGFEEMIREVAGNCVNDLLELGVMTTEDLPIEELLQTVGLAYVCIPRKNEQDFGGVMHSRRNAHHEMAGAPTLGITLASGESDAKIGTVYYGGAAQIAGLSSGDIILAINGWQVSRGDLFDRIARFAVGDEITIHAFHRDRLLTYMAKLQAIENSNCELIIVDDANPEILKRRLEWLGTEA